MAETEHMASCSLYWPTRPPVRPRRSKPGCASRGGSSARPDTNNPQHGTRRRTLCLPSYSLQRASGSHMDHHPAWAIRHQKIVVRQRSQHRLMGRSAPPCESLTPSGNRAGFSKALPSISAVKFEVLDAGADGHWDGQSRRRGSTQARASHSRFPQKRSEALADIRRRPLQGASPDMAGSIPDTRCNRVI